MTVYLLEDETNVLKHLMALVADVPYLKLIGWSDTVEKGRREIASFQPELILADIELKDGNSFEVFGNLDISADIIFITAYDRYAIDALNMGALGYLLKPIDAKNFTDTIDRCFRKSEAYKFDKRQVELSLTHYYGKSTLQRLALKSTGHTLIVNIADILYCHSDKGYTTFYLRNEKPYMVSKVIKEYEGLLPVETFLRCHQSYLVNVAYISKYYKEGYIVMTSGVKIPVSARKKSFIQDFIEKMR
ncbi:LytR/AlgR family response regulator transcription factor [Chryseobacterium sp. 22543]|uniref:LytR/AlgR family response regulator transcription factor n=1 Tax=Chryseobacterium sp. 22543 TaxID=3453940 RepID=UPI003F854679